MKMTYATSLVLKAGIFIGLALIVIGLFTFESILWTGTLILICSPLLGVVTSYVFLMKEKDWKWAKITTILILVIIIGLFVSLI